MRTCLLCEATSAGTAVRFRKSSHLCQWCEAELARTGRLWCTRGRHIVTERATGKLWCKACERARNAAYARERDAAAYAKTWRAANPERVKSANAAYRAEHNERLRAYARARYWANPEDARAKSRASHARRRQAARQYARWYYWQRPEQMRQDARARHARRKLKVWWGR